MKPVYVIATEDGRKPSTILKTENQAKQGLALCKKGWPNEKWVIFGLDYENNGKFEKGILSLAGMKDSAVKDTLFEEMTNRCYLDEVVR